MYVTACSRVHLGVLDARQLGGKVGKDPPREVGELPESVVERGFVETVGRSEEEGEELLARDEQHQGLRWVIGR